MKSFLLSHLHVFVGHACLLLLVLHHSRKPINEDAQDVKET